ncbi:MAG: hypothetical protein N4A61_16900 [Pelagimonas sp.]|jgi:hypothetical protein|nr:hypothetical protein [Pelagimonas sp.]
MHSDGTFERLWKFVDQYEQGDEITRMALDIAIDDVVSGLSAALGAAIRMWDAAVDPLPEGIKSGNMVIFLSGAVLGGKTFKAGDFLIATADFSGADLEDESWVSYPRWTFTNQGAWSPLQGAFPSQSRAGDFWVVSRSGVFAGINFVQGDRLMALEDNAPVASYGEGWWRISELNGAEAAKSFKTFTDFEADLMLTYEAGSVGTVVVFVRIALYMIAGRLVAGGWLPADLASHVTDPAVVALVAGALIGLASLAWYGMSRARRALRGAA